jgi:hypothetical protein
MRTVETAVANVVSQVWRGGFKQATKIISQKFVVKATRRLSERRKPRPTDNVDIVLTMGRPNYADRLFIKQCVKAKEPFPIKKIQLKAIPAKRKEKPVAFTTRRKTKHLKVRSLAAKVLGQTRARG